MTFISFNMNTLRELFTMRQEVVPDVFDVFPGMAWNLNIKFNVFVPCIFLYVIIFNNDKGTL